MQGTTNNFLKMITLLNRLALGFYHNLLKLEILIFNLDIAMTS
jgi:hypothetical protein